MATTQWKKNNITYDIHDSRLPSSYGTAGQVLATNLSCTGIEWVNQSAPAQSNVYKAIVGITTYTDVLTAYNDGKIVIAEKTLVRPYGNNVSQYRLSRVDTTNNLIIFISIGNTNNSVTTYTLNSSSQWGDGTNNIVSVATTSNAGIVKPDGTTITINNGVISSSGTSYTAGNGINIDNNVISSKVTFTLNGTELTITST